MACVARGDTEALGELYTRFAPTLVGMLRRILPSPGAAEEVFEKVLLRLWKEAARFPREGSSVAAWLFITARSRAVGVRRAQQNLPPLSKLLSDSADADLAWLPRPEAVRQLEERRELLRKVLNQLPKPQRAALELAVFDGHTEEEIAVKLGEPLGRVKSGLRAGMRFLRHRLRAVTGTWAANL